MDESNLLSPAFVFSLHFAKLNQLDMKRNLLLLLLLTPVSIFAQNVTFWAEDFGFGCNSGQFADGFISINTGVWTVQVLGAEADLPNTWFISAEENGNQAGECGSACGDDPSLHLGANGSFLGTDIGAAYYEGLDAFCGLIECGATDKRVESPIINCSGMGNVVVNFAYLEGGNGIDNCTFWYFDGSDWTMLEDLPKTVLDCFPQGQWTDYSVALPPSSNNNTNIKIGFHWINNDDGDATDPSFAVDDIFMTGDFAVDLVAPEVICPPDYVLFTEDYCAIMPDLQGDAIIFDDVDPFPVITQDPMVGTDLVPGDYIITITATDNSNNSNFCNFILTVIDDDSPVIDCPANITIQIPEGELEADVVVPIPDVADNCGGFTLSNDYNGAQDASGTYPLGTTTVNYTATDDSDNVNECSFTVTVQSQPQDCCLADYNCDGYISVADLIYLVNDFGCTSGCTTDLDNNGSITVVDMQIFTGLYGTICPP